MNFKDKIVVWEKKPMKFKIEKRRKAGKKKERAKGLSDQQFLIVIYKMG